MSQTKEDHMGPYSSVNCLHTATSTSEPAPAWSLQCHKFVLKTNAFLFFLFFFRLLDELSEGNEAGFKH